MNALHKTVLPAQSKEAAPFSGTESAMRPLPGGLLFRAWRWIHEHFSKAANPRRLQVTANVPLGEKRFVAVVKVDGREFLVGGGASNVALLAPLETKEDFSELLDQSVERAAEEPLAKPKVGKRATRPVSAPVAKAGRQTRPATEKKTPQRKADKAENQLRISARMSMAPALGHFINPQFQKVSVKSANQPVVAGKKRTRKQA